MGALLHNRKAGRFEGVGGMYTQRLWRKTWTWHWKASEGGEVHWRV